MDNTSIVHDGEDLKKEPIKIFSLGCPKCEYVVSIAKLKGIEFEMISDCGKVMDAAEKFGFEEIPFAIIDGQPYDSAAIEKYLMEA